MELFRHDVTLAPDARRIYRRPVRVALATLLAFPNVGQALGLGRPSGEPILGESLQLVVPLIGTVDRPLDNDCVTLHRPPDSIDADYFPRDLVAQIDRQGAQKASRLLLSTRSALRQPIVEFRISITCGYNLSHDYLLMASPRNERVQPATATASGTAADSAAASRAGSVPETPAIATPGAREGGPLPDGLPGKDFTLDRAMTLEQIARQHFPGPLRQERFMRWVAEANPQLFTGVTNLRQHRLTSGQSLMVPDGVPPRRPGDHQSGSPPLGESVAAGDSRVTTARKARVTAGAATPPGKTASDAQKDLLVVGAGGGNARDMKETVALVDRLTGMMQQQLSAQTSNDEKIQKLESEVAELGKQVVKLESDQRQREAAWQAELQAARQARADETESGWWQLLVAVVGGGLVGAGLLQASRRLAARRPVDDAPPTAPAPQSPKPATAIHSGPLTGFGWDDEPHHEASRQDAPAMTNRVAPPAAPSATAAAMTASPPTSKPPVASMVVPIMSTEPLFDQPARSTAALKPIDFEPPDLDKFAALADARPKTTATPIDTAQSDPATAAIELANIMISMGLAESAAQTLVEHIRSNPRQSLQHWLKLLELHRLNGNRTEFERSANEMREHFNVQADEWTQGIGVTGRGSLETYPHIRSQIVALWGEPVCLPFLQSLLIDNREGTRIGFPLPVAEEILLLIAILSSNESP